MYVCLSLHLNLNVFVYVLSLAHIYIYIERRISAYIMASSYVYPYFRCLLVERGEAKEESVRREENVRREWKNNCYHQNDFFFLLVLTLYLIAKGLFDVNMKCLFCGEFD